MSISPWDETVGVEKWRAAAELCAEDVAMFWSEDGKVGMALLCNDVFGPAADAEEVGPEDVEELLRMARQGPRNESWRVLMRWVAQRRGYGEKPLWCDSRAARAQHTAP